MSEKVPHKNKYALANRLAKTLNYILILSTIISVLILAYNLFAANPSNQFNEWSGKVLAFLAIVYFCLDLIKSNAFHKAEFARKNDFIDNSMKTNLSEENSVGYFTNDELDKGITKLGANCFENSFFTKSIAQKMLKKQFFYFSIVVVAILSIVIFFENPIVVKVLLLALPYSITLDTYKLYRLQQNSDSVFSNFKRIFSSTKKSKMEFLIIDNTINYEKALSEAGILLDSKIFTKMNSKLSGDWDKIKSKYIK